jgi:A/G-specific adenine glycosylase
MPPASRRRHPAAIQAALLRHYDRAHRDLPWRRTRAPYRIWVSEIMLQQTQVETVIPYYRRFLKSFPTVRALARAPLGRVLKLWEGLGYYSRARHLRAAAKTIVGAHGGRLPRDREALLDLPGIGRYTAGAILSIAFGRREPVVDGNVIRILSRLAAIGGDPSSARVKERFWSMASALVPARRAGDFNQSLMELGALICTPRSPRCGDCPIRRWCRARRLGRQEDFPARPPAKAIPRRAGAAAVIERGRRVLVVRRPDEGLLGGLWELPWVYRNRGESVAAAARRAARERAGISARAVASLAPVAHAFSHFHLTLTPVRCRAGTPSGRARRGRSAPEATPARGATTWIDPRRPTGLAVHTSMRRILQDLVRDI